MEYQRSVVSCDSIRGIPECRNMELIAGEQGLGRQIVWVHYVEEASYIHFIRGKELVLTTGVLLHSEEEFLDFIRNLYRKNASGLVINELPEGGIPFIDGIVALGNELGFPIFSLPFRCRFEDISRSICHEVFLREQRSLQKGMAMCSLFFDESGQHSASDPYCNYDLDRKFVSAVIKVGEPSVLKIPAFSNQISSYLEYCSQYYFREILFAMNDHEIALAVPLAKAENKAAVRRIISAIGKEIYSIINNSPIYIGISSIWHGRQSFYNNLVNARFMATLCQNSKESELDYDQSGSLKLIISLGCQKELERYYSDSVRRLKDSDLNHGTEYLSTLFAYAKNNCNLQATADDLFVHYNTLRYRLRAIEDLLDIDFKSPRDISNLIFLWNIKQYLDCIGLTG